MTHKEKFVFLVSIGAKSFDKQYHCDRTMEAVAMAMDVKEPYVEHCNRVLAIFASDFLEYFYSNGDKHSEWKGQIYEN